MQQATGRSIRDFSFSFPCFNIIKQKDKEKPKKVSLYSNTLMMSWTITLHYYETLREEEEMMTTTTTD